MYFITSFWANYLNYYTAAQGYPSDNPMQLFLLIMIHTTLICTM